MLRLRLRRRPGRPKLGWPPPIRRLAGGPGAAVDFLLQTQPPNSVRRLEAALARPPGPGLLGQTGETFPKPQTGAEAREQAREQARALRRAVLGHDPTRADALFGASPALQGDPYALRWMLRRYIWDYDFTTAKALLMQFMDVAGSRAIYSFLLASWRTSGNAADLEEVFWRATEVPGLSRHGLSVLAATALFGFRALRRPEQARAVEQFVRRRGLGSALPLLQVQIYDLYVAGEFDRALELGRVFVARKREAEEVQAGAKTASGGAAPADPAEARLEPTAPYRWAVAHYAPLGDVQSLQRVLADVDALHGRAPASLVHMALAHLPAQYPQLELPAWLELCRENGWPVGAPALKLLVEQAVAWHPSLRDALWAKFSEVAAARGLEAAARAAPSEPVFHSRRSPFARLIKRHVRRGEPERALDVLRGLRRRGFVPPYRLFVDAFRALAVRGPGPALDELTRLMLDAGHSLHCAGTDLAMVERHARAAESPAVVGQIVERYLAQYPLHTHDRGQLLRLSVVLDRHAAQPAAALDALDFLRVHEAGARYSRRNHTSRSLQHALALRQRLGRPVAAWVRRVLADAPQIVLDADFERALARALAPAASAAPGAAPDAAPGAAPDALPALLEEVRAHNRRVTAAVLAQVDEIGAGLADQPPRG